MKTLSQKMALIFFASASSSLMLGCGDDSEKDKNQAVSVASVNDQRIENGESLSIQLDVSDPDDENNGTDITFTKVSGPESLTISDTGLITYTSNIDESRTVGVEINVADGGEDNVAEAVVKFNLEEQFFYTFDGSLTDIQTTSPIEGGTITLSANGEDIFNTITAENGLYTAKFSDTYRTESITMSAQAQGYTDKIESYQAGQLSNYANIRLEAVAAIRTFNASEGAALAFEDSVIAYFSGGDIQTATGEIYNGEVSAELTPINPLYNAEALPGELTVLDDDAVKGFESFGAIAVNLFDDEGNSLNVADDTTVQIRIPASREQGNLPDAVTLYYYDKSLGSWIKEGEATLENGYYIAEVSHFSFWTVGQEFETATVTGCVADKEGNLVNGARVLARGFDNATEASTQTDAEGKFTLELRQFSEFIISAYQDFPSRPVEFELYNNDKMLEECLVIEKVVASVNLRWLANPKDLDTHWDGPTADGGTFKLFYANPEVKINGVVSFLDVDDVDGYGPEVLSVPEFSVPGDYHYYVHLFSGTGTIVSGSARVELSVNNTKITYFPPSEGAPTLIWHVFSLEVSDDLLITVKPGTGWRDNYINLVVENEDESDEANFSPAFNIQTIMAKPSRSIHPNKMPR